MSGLLYHPYKAGPQIKYADWSEFGFDGMIIQMECQFLSRKAQMPHLPVQQPVVL
jgi:hypothetical protein